MCKQQAEAPNKAVAAMSVAPCVSTEIQEQLQLHLTCQTWASIFVEHVLLQWLWCTAEACLASAQHLPESTAGSS